jgi:hypothetical protein
VMKPIENVLIASNMGGAVVMIYAPVFLVLPDKLHTWNPWSDSWGSMFAISGNSTE